MLNRLTPSTNDAALSPPPAFISSIDLRLCSRVVRDVSFGSISSGIDAKKWGVNQSGFSLTVHFFQLVARKIFSSSFMLE